ncbi:MAG: hypothetical protein M1816_007928 [Peltula sp. TS41687]|nr:MAG: hypothetical protein M1816_007928 [Peltula sp. TS41687]
MAEKPTGTEETQKSLLHNVRRWGESPFPPTLLATLITAQHARPPQFMPLLFPPVLLFSAYLNLNDYVVDSAGVTAAWSGLYLLMARRRKQAFASKWSVRGMVRGATMGTCVVNLLGGGLVYAFGKRTPEEEAAEKDVVVKR